MAITYEPIGTTTVGTATTSVTFSSISQAYTDLVAVVQHKSVATVCGLVCQVGAGTIITTADYSINAVLGDSSTAFSAKDTNRSNMSFSRGNGDDNSHWQFTKINFMNYTNTTTNKSVLYRLANAAQESEAGINTLRNTTNINIITFALTGSGLQFAVGSTFTLYGIKAA